MALKLRLNNKIHDSEYNSEILEDGLKVDYHFYFPKDTITVVGDTKNNATKVADYFSEDV